MTKKITESEAAPLRIASLPTRPTAPTAFGGKGYTSVEMKEAFDKLPNLITERLNSLIDDIESGRVAESIPVLGTDKLSTLADLMHGIESGELAGAINVLGSSLTATVARLQSDVALLKERMGDGG